MATAELAVVMPVLVLVLSALLAVLGLVHAQIRCADAAHEAARATARGDVGRVGALATSAAGGPVDVDTRPVGPGLVSVTVRLRHQPARGLPSVTLSETAVVLVEPDSPDDAEP
jgi:hypothetical protein